MKRPIKRAVHFDFHTMPGIDNFGERFDAAAFAEQMKEANVEYVNMFARCNIGFSYYDTKVGVKYPGLKSNMLADVVRECHKRDIGVTGYLNTSINHEIAIRHPEWCIVRFNGKICDFGDNGERKNSFRAMCYNSGYADHFISEIKEILALGVDGIFCDCYLADPCRCQTCSSLMIKEGIDPRDDDAAVAFSEKTKDRFMKKIRAAVPDDKRLIISVVGPHRGRNINSHYESECLPSQWGYDYFVPYASFARTIYDTVVFMNGRFQICWGDFGGYKGKASIENDVYDALSQGVSTMLGDHLHPADVPIKDIYRDLGEIYGRVKAYEEWTDGARYVPEIAILTGTNFLSQGVGGAVRMLSELKYTFDVVWYEDDFSKYDLIVIPDGVRFDEALAKSISDYLKAGGKVISAGLSGLCPEKLEFALDEWSFEPVAYTDKSVTAVINRGECGFTTYFGLNYESGLADMLYSEYETAMSMKAGEGSTSLADEYRSYFERSGWDGTHYIFYTPPKEATGNSVMAVNSLDNVAHISFPIFLAYRKSLSAVYKNMIKTLIERFMPNSLIKAEELPSTSRVTLTGKDDYKLLHVKVTYPEVRYNMGIVEEHNELCEGKTIAVRGEYKTVEKLPEKSAVKAEIRDGYTYITLPKIVGYDMFLLK